MQQLCETDHCSLRYDTATGIVYHWFSGEHTKEEAEKILAFLSEILKKYDRPLLALIDAREATMVQAQARKLYADFMKSDNLDRAAFLVSGVVMRVVVNMVFSVSGKKDKMRMFKDKKEALRWLKS